jgi:hypothetical protein
MAPATAIVAVLAGGAAFGLSQIGGSTSSGSAASSGLGEGRAEPAIGAGLGKVAGPKDHRNNPQFQLGPSPSGAAAAASAPTSRPFASQLRLVPSGIDFAHATLARQVSAQLKMLHFLKFQPASAQVSGCVMAVTGGEQPVLVERARYAGRPAIVIVAHRQAVYHVWVTAAGCSAGQPDVLDQTDVPDPVPGTSTP